MNVFVCFFLFTSLNMLCLPQLWFGSFTPTYREVYLIQPRVIKFVNDINSGCNFVFILIGDFFYVPFPVPFCQQDCLDQRNISDLNICLV